MKRRTIDFERAKQTALETMPDWLPGHSEGRMKGRELFLRSPLRPDHEAGSFSINVDTGSWHDFATNEGGDALSLYCRVIHGSDSEETRTLAARKLTGGKPPSSSLASPLVSRKPEKEPVPLCDPLPAGDPEGVRGYSDKYDYQGNGISFRVYRFDDSGGKSFRQCYFSAGNWIFKRPEKPAEGFPLYNLDILQARPGSLVVLSEGEKTCKAVQAALGNQGTASTWCGGSSAVHQADFSALAGRMVVLWPDNDAPGQKAMDFVQAKLLALGSRVFRVLLDPTWPEGFDAADCLNPEEVARKITAAPPVGAGPEEADQVEEAGEPEELAEEKPADTAVKQLREIDLSDLFSLEIAPPEFIDDKGLLPIGQPTLCGGHGGVGKTYVVLAMICHAAVGGTWAGITFKKKRCTFVSLEEPAETIKYRIWKIIQENGLNYREVVKGIRVFDGTDAESTELVEYEHGKGSTTRLYQEVKEACSGAEFVVVDNASDAFGGDEIRKREVRYFIRKLAHIAKENRAAVLLLAHIDKAAARNGSSGESYSGNTAWHNSVKSRFAILKDQKSGEISLVHEKSNYWKLMEGKIALEFENGVPKGSGAADSDASYFGIEQTSMDTKILQAMKRAIESGDTVYPSRKGTCSFFSCLKNYGLSSEARQDVYDGLDRLLKAGQVKTERFTKDRKEHIRIVFVSD